jgi:hypothetical protein
MAEESLRHSPGTLGTPFSGAPDTIRTCDLCLSGLAPTLPVAPKAVAVTGPIGRMDSDAPCYAACRRDISARASSPFAVNE